MLLYDIPRGRKEIDNLSPREHFFCTQCHKQIEPKKVEVELKAANITFCGLLSIKTITYKKQEYVLVCPLCKKVNLFGFKSNTSKP